MFSRVMNLFDFLEFAVNNEHDNFSSLFEKINNDDILKYKFGNTDNDSIGARLKHACSAEYRMAGYLFEKPDDIVPEIDEFSVSSLKNAFNLSRKRHIETLKNLKIEDLDKEWQSKTGKVFSYKYLLYHFLEHLATHRGQVTTALRMYNESLNNK